MRQTLDIRGRYETIRASCMEALLTPETKMRGNRLGYERVDMWYKESRHRRSKPRQAVLMHMRTHSRKSQ